MKTNMTTVVVISSAWPSTDNGSGFAVRSLLDECVEAASEVQLIGLTDSKPVDNDCIPSKVQWTHINIRRLPIPVRFLLGISSSLPAICIQFASRRVIDQLLISLRQVFGNNNRHVVIFEDLPLAITFLPLVHAWFPTAGIAIRSENVLSKIFDPLARHGNPFMKLAWSLELFKMRRAEVEVCRRADRVWSISEKDSHDYLELLGIRCNGVFGISVSSDRYASVAGGDSQTVVYVGGVDLRKRLGITNFIKEAWPAIRSEVPNARFVLAGKGSERINNPSLGIYGLGYVRDDQSVWAQGQIALNPQELGSGIKLKSIISMLCAKSLVTTETGVEGIPAQNGKHFLMAPNAGALAPLVVQLMKNPSQAIEMGQTARDWATETYAREQLRRCARPLIEDMIQVVRKEDLVNSKVQNSSASEHFQR